MWEVHKDRNGHTIDPHSQFSIGTMNTIAEFILGEFNFVNSLIKIGEQA